MKLVKKEGFTLIELLCVVSLIAVLCSVTGFMFSGSQRNHNLDYCARLIIFYSSKAKRYAQKENCRTRVLFPRENDSMVRIISYKGNRWNEIGKCFEVDKVLSLELEDALTKQAVDFDHKMEGNLYSFVEFDHSGLVLPLNPDDFYDSDFVPASLHLNLVYRNSRFNPAENNSLSLNQRTIVFSQRGVNLL